MNGGVLVARPQFPHPGDLDPAANPAARTIHETALKAHADHSALAEIKAAMLESLGEANREHIRDPVLGLHNHTLLTIIAAMVLLHGQYTESDVLLFLQDLETKLTSLDDFDSHVGKFAKTLRKLALAGTPAQASAACSGFPATKHRTKKITKCRRALKVENKIPVFFVFSHACYS
jgi:hypothetical protein